jgi:hypothetical protein
MKFQNVSYFPNMFPMKFPNVFPHTFPMKFQNVSLIPRCVPKHVPKSTLLYPISIALCSTLVTYIHSPKGGEHHIQQDMGQLNTNYIIFTNVKKFKKNSGNKFSEGK